MTCAEERPIPGGSGQKGIGGYGRARVLRCLYLGAAWQCKVEKATTAGMSASTDVFASLSFQCALLKKRNQERIARQAEHVSNNGHDDTTLAVNAGVVALSLVSTRAHS